MENLTVRTQANFSGGLNLRVSPIQLNDGEYARLFNGRTRNGGIEPITRLKQIKSIPAGKIQGIYAVDQILLIFIGGKAYWKNYATTNPGWTIISGFQLDATVDYIYACAVPASTINWSRKLMTADQAESGIIYNTTTVGRTPSAIVCQDGKNQPWLISPNGTARQAKFWSDWSDTNVDSREYVPIGKQMVYSGGKLYIAGKDANGRFTQLFQSVTGRPLDFVVNVKSDGTKGGDASTTAHQVDYSEITALSNLSLAGTDGFYVSTVKTSYLVLPSYDSLVFGEPKFTNVFLFDVGALNNFSVVELNGDTAIIDTNGVRSFNAVSQLKVRGNNAPFSAKVQPLFDGVIQRYAATVNFDNYSMFAVDSIYGQGILVYDNITQQWVSFDKFSDLSRGSYITKFASIETGTIKGLFFTTSDNKLWEAYSTDEAVETVYVYIGEQAPDPSNQEFKPELVVLNFVDVIESGTVNATCYLDSKSELALSNAVVQNTISSPQASITTPYTSNLDLSRPISFNFTSVRAGWRVGYYINWNFRGKLASANMFFNIVSEQQTRKQQASAYVRFINQQ